MTAAMTETTQILDGHFTAYAALGPITPTIMAAREERYRATNLDTLRNDDPDVAWDGNLLRVNMATERVPVQTIAGLSWAPYQYDVDNTTWYASPIETYWDELERRYADDLVDETEDSRAGHLLIMQVVYVTLYRGATSVVQIADFVLQQNYQTTDKPLAFKVLGFVGTAVKFVVNTIVMQGANAVLYASRIGAYANSLWFHRIGVANPMGTMKALATQLARYLRGLWNGGVRSIKTLGAIANRSPGSPDLGDHWPHRARQNLSGREPGARIAVATIVGVAMFALHRHRPVSARHQPDRGYPRHHGSDSVVDHRRRAGWQVGACWSLQGCGHRRPDHRRCYHLGSLPVCRSQCRFAAGKHRV